MTTPSLVRLGSCVLAVLAMAAGSARPDEPADVVKGRSELRVETRSAIAPQRDPLRGTSYTASCRVLFRRGADETPCIDVFMPDASLLPLGRKVARFMALLYDQAHARSRALFPRLRGDTVRVWLARDGEPGGRNWDRDLFVWSVLDERTGLEWARTLAHEYGHYLLPGASGYTQPEDWLNGLLGERLFLSWLAADMEAGQLDQKQAPFVSPADLRDYCAKQVAPLRDAVCADGPNRKLLAQTDKVGANAFTGLMLYIDSVHGTTGLLDILAYLPNSSRRATGPDFLAAYEGWRTEARDVVSRSVGAAMFFLPARTFTVTPVGANMHLRVPGATVAAAGNGRTTVTVRRSGWYRLSMADPPPALMWSAR